jgi:hypothetical protein
LNDKQRKTSNKECIKVFYVRVGSIYLNVLLLNYLLITNLWEIVVVLAGSLIATNKTGSLRDKWWDLYLDYLESSTGDST